MKDSFSNIIEGEKPVLVDFYATWCEPCHMMKPILEELSKEIGDNARIIKIDIDKNPAVASRYRINSVPTLMLYKKGEVKWRQSGVVPVHVIRKAIDSL